MDEDKIIMYKSIEHHQENTFIVSVHNIILYGFTYSPFPALP